MILVNSPGVVLDDLLTSSKRMLLEMAFLLGSRLTESRPPRKKRSSFQTPEGNLTHTCSSDGLDESDRRAEIRGSTNAATVPVLREIGTTYEWFLKPSKREASKNRPASDTDAREETWRSLIAYYS